uniref:Phytoene synthase n=1 Tax=Rhodopseudomonas palustris (strain BisA53) TaxID=316055 RepID=Q07MJ3_RHOP5
MSAPAPQADAASFCAELVRSHDFDRYAATLFVAPEPRRALLALYAFNVEIVRVRDLVTQPLPGEIRLQWWSDLLAGTAHGAAEGNPVAAELLWAIDAQKLPTAPLERLIEAHQFDLYNDPMPDLAALQDYLDATVGSLIGLAATVLGAPVGSVAHLAHHAGVGIGIARLIAAMPRDSSRRQLFLPLQAFTEAGSGLEEAFAGKPTPTLRAALAKLIAEARDHLDQAGALLAEAPAEARPALLAQALARRDLDQMARPEFDPFVPHPRSRLAALWTLWRASRARAFRG